MNNISALDVQRNLRRATFYPAGSTSLPTGVLYSTFVVVWDKESEPGFWVADSSLGTEAEIVAEMERRLDVAHRPHASVYPLRKWEQVERALQRAAALMRAHRDPDLVQRYLDAMVPRGKA